jgi:hypothetical protein
MLWYEFGYTARDVFCFAFVMRFQKVFATRPRCTYELVHYISHLFIRIHFLNLVLLVGQFTVGNLLHVFLSLRNPVTFCLLFFILSFYSRPLLIFILSRSKSFYFNSLVYHFSTLNGSSDIFTNCEVQYTCMSILQLLKFAV